VGVSTIRRPPARLERTGYLIADRQDPTVSMLNAEPAPLLDRHANREAFPEKGCYNRWGAVWISNHATVVHSVIAARRPNSDASLHQNRNQRDQRAPGRCHTRACCSVL